MQIRPSTVSGDGIDLAVWERGEPDAPTVVLVHGYPDTHILWDRVAEHLAEEHHVVTYDVRGAGASGTPADQEGYDLDHLVADLAAVVDATSPDRPVHLVGHDWGSIQSWAAITDDRLAGRIASFTSISGPSLDHVSRWMRDRVTLHWAPLRQLLAQGARSWYVAMFQVPGVAELAWRTVQPEAFRRYLQRVEGVPANALPAATLPRDGANGVQLYRQNVGARARSAGPRPTDVPVQLIVPLGDRFVSPAIHDGTSQHVSDLRRRDIDGGHWVVITEAAQIASWIATHADEVRSRTS